MPVRSEGSSPARLALARPAASRYPWRSAFPIVTSTSGASGLICWARASSFIAARSLYPDRKSRPCSKGACQQFGSMRSAAS